MEVSPKVSIIIPAYNVYPYIRQSVESTLRQTVANIEVLVIDDGSTDGTVEQLVDIRDHRLRIIRKAHTGSLPQQEHWNSPGPGLLYRFFGW